MQPVSVDLRANLRLGNRPNCCLYAELVNFSLPTPTVDLTPHKRTLRGFEAKSETERPLFFRISRKIKSTVHDFRCREVLKTRPLEIRPSHVRIVSMVSHRDLILYLVAIKSFYRRLGQGEMVIIDDGTLTEADHSILSQHLGRPKIIRVSDVQTGRCPHGGTWERLLTILDMSKQFFVIQLDSDTLTVGDVSEVLECIRLNRSFTLGTNSGKEFVNLVQASGMVRDEQADHVTIAAEKNLCRIRNPETRRYVRGSSGFAGFARALGSRDDAAEFSDQMTSLIGSKWNEWGSEQVASNYVVANSPGAIVLPYPKYMCFWNQTDPADSSFVHFIGTHRYDRGVYARESKTFIRSQFV